MRVPFSPHAAGDAAAALDYYAGIDPALSSQFLDDVEAAIDRIVTFPDGAPPVEGFDHLRRARMRRFPYGVFYQLTPPGDLLIVRLFHTRRHHDAALGG